MKIHPLPASQPVYSPPPGARPAPPVDIHVPALDSQPPREEEKRRPFPWKTALGAAGAAVAALAGIFGPGIVAGQRLIEAPVTVPIRDGFGEWVYAGELDTLEGKEIHVKVEVPPELRGRGKTSVQIFAHDAWNRHQASSWSGGQPVPENFRYDEGVLELVYTPTRDLVGEGFSAHLPLSRLGVRINTDGEAAAFKLLDVRVKAASARSGPPAVVRPLLRFPNPPPTPVPAGELKTGVSRYFDYGDLHRWDEVRPQMEQALEQQQGNGLTAFRWMGGLDVRRSAGGVRLTPREYAAMREALEMAEKHGQKDFIFTLLDGAIPNETLRQAMEDPKARKQLIDQLRPFVREFGGKPVVWDLVNEIHGLDGVTDRQRQELVEDMIRMVAREAPGATVTVGVQNVRELAYWTHLTELFRGQPVKIVYTFHLYEDVENLPPASALNLPPGAEVGITEAAPGAGMERQLRAASQKGYRWLLFWQDREHRYDPGEHREALGRVASRPNAKETHRGQPPVTWTAP